MNGSNFAPPKMGEDRGRILRQKRTWQKSEPDHTSTSILDPIYEVCSLSENTLSFHNVKIGVS